MHHDHYITVLSPQLSSMKMKISYFLGILFSFCAIISYVVFFRAPSPSDYDHLMLVMDWPNGYCSSRSCVLSPLPQKFVLHGLWPVTIDGKDIQNCDPSADITQIFEKDPQLQTRVLEDWPSLSATKEDITAQRSFWNMQWTKHGSCQTAITAPDKYFYKALELNGRVDLLNTLATEQITAGGSYTRAKYTGAIQAKIGQLSVFFRCVTKNNVELLQEVVVCVDKSAENFIGCDKELGRDNCKTDDIKLPDQVEFLQEAADHNKNMQEL